MAYSLSINLRSSSSGTPINYNIIMTSLALVSPGNRTDLYMSSAKIHPTDHISVGNDQFIFNSASGERYGCVVINPVFFLLFLINLEQPKSIILIFISSGNIYSKSNSLLILELNFELNSNCDNSSFLYIYIGTGVFSAAYDIVV